MKLFEFRPTPTGYDSYYVMSENIENAFESLCKLDGFSKEFYEKHKEKYTICEYGVNEPTWSENC